MVLLTLLGSFLEIVQLSDITQDDQAQDGTAAVSQYKVGYGVSHSAA